MHSCLAVLASNLATAHENADRAVKFHSLHQDQKLVKVLRFWKAKAEGKADLSCKQEKAERLYQRNTLRSVLHEWEWHAVEARAQRAEQEVSILCLCSQ